MSDLREYITELNDLPKEILLGRIVVFTIYDHPIRLSEVTASFSRLGLNPAYLPKPNKRHDAFKKATKELDRVQYDMTSGRTGNLLCREVSSTNDYIVRQITREIRDKANRKLTYTEAIHVRYMRGNENLIHVVREENLEAEEVAAIKGFARRIKDRYDYHADFLDNMKIRAMVRDYLKHLNCVEIKPGVYYVNCSKDDELHRLAELVNDLGGGCHMNMIPIVNIERERRYITRMFEREAADQLSGIKKEIEGVLRDRKSISPSLYAKMEAKYAEVMARAEEHQITLDIHQSLTLASEKAASDALNKLKLRLIQGGD